MNVKTRGVIGELQTYRKILWGYKLRIHLCLLGKKGFFFLCIFTNDPSLNNS